MTSDTLQKWMYRFYLLVFFGFLFGPLVMMTISAFNTPSIPQAWPVEGVTTHWFDVLFNDRFMMESILNSLWIGIGVVAVAVPIGMAAALLMEQVHEKFRATYYTIVVSPVLMPGVILGISTLVFWDRLARGAGYDPRIQEDAQLILFDGHFLTIMGQSTFIAAYAMLVFLARLQRFDRTQEEAALDLGASHVQVFRRIKLPFLMPAIASASVLAFLSSFENYNTTLFTIRNSKTITTYLAGKVRTGTMPDISALAVVIIIITLIGAICFEILRRREQRKAEAEREAARRAEAEIDKKLARVY